jgi:uncharacterized membrane protein YhaH (DUF805 family)
MTDALEGPRVRKVTLREQANSQRIGRGRFIGNTAGILLLVVLIEVGLTFAGLQQSLQIDKGAFGLRRAVTLTLPNLGAAIAGSLVLLLCLLDLAVRRRHDRGQSGADTAAILMLLELIGVGYATRLLIGAPPMVVLTVVGIALLYLLVALAVLPGNKGPNRYGPNPRLP